MIRHILFIIFKNGTHPIQIDNVRKLFMSLPNEIKGVKDVEWGVNDSPESLNGNFTHCVLMTFENDAVRRYYLEHQAHHRLKTIFQPLLDDVIVLDYRVDE